jgi:hypothetical protein
MEHIFCRQPKRPGMRAFKQCWRKGKSETALAPQGVNCSNSNKNSYLEYLMKSKFLDADPSTSIPPTIFCLAMKKVIELRK